MPPARVSGISRLLGGLLLAAFCLRCVAADSAAHRMLNADDFFRVEDVSEPQVSPDGLCVAYFVSSNDRDSDEARSAIWMVSWDGRQKLALTSATDGTDKPRWSPDGGYVAFVTGAVDSEKGQFMLLDRRGGDAQQLINFTGDIGEYAWSPDGKQLVVAMEQAEEENFPK